MLNGNALVCYRKAGRITSEVAELASKAVFEGAKALELCDEIEGAIVKMGGNPAFPCNVGINEVAAHYTSPPHDPTVVPQGSLVKLDFGVQVEGYIADTALTISLDTKHEPIVLAAKEALKAAIEIIRPGIRAREVGSIIEKRIEEYGCRPVRNLTGHEIRRCVLHTGKAVPNVHDLNGAVLRCGEVYAIEPFVTLREAAGRVQDADTAHIFRFNRTKGARTVEERALLDYIRSTYSNLPFALRWLYKNFSEKSVDGTFRTLLDSKCIASYPVLVETTHQPVAQAEHTVVVNRDGCEVLTAQSSLSPRIEYDE